MDMPEALGRKLTDSSFSERLTGRRFLRPYFFALKYTKSVKKTIDIYTELVYIIITERKERRAKR